MTITLTREEAQQVLEALAELNRLSIGKDAICLPAEIDDAMEILEARLAQPEPEPVAWEDVLGAIGRGWAYPENAHKTMDVELAVAIAKEFQELYTAPPQREWQGLTDEEVGNFTEAVWPREATSADFICAAAIRARGAP